MIAPRAARSDRRPGCGKAAMLGAEFASVECPICLYELCDGDHGCVEEGLDDDAVVLPCAHAFHGRCLRPWFALAYSDALRAGEAPTLACPVCRSVLPEGEPEA